MVPILPLYETLQALGDAHEELRALGIEVDGVLAELLRALAEVTSMRMRIQRLRNPFFRERMERFRALACAPTDPTNESAAWRE